jgi:hypothetical protein
MRAVIEGAERPATTDVRKIYVSLCSTKFDFRIKMVVNVELLRSLAAKSNGYGVKVGEDVTFLIIIANIEWRPVKTGADNFVTQCAIFANNTPTTRYTRRQHAPRS